MSKSPKTTAKLSKRAETSVVLFFNGVLFDVRAYTATVSNCRTPQSGIIKNYILVS